MCHMSYLLELLFTLIDLVARQVWYAKLLIDPNILNGSLFIHSMFNIKIKVSVNA